jgi:hypothetical protein
MMIHDVYIATYAILRCVAEPIFSLAAGQHQAGIYSSLLGRFRPRMCQPKDQQTVEKMHLATSVKSSSTSKSSNNGSSDLQCVGSRWLQWPQFPLEIASRWVAHPNSKKVRPGKLHLEQWAFGRYHDVPKTT